MDMSLECSKCKNAVSAVSLREHQDQHSALNMLKFKNVKRGPATVETLLKRRRLMIKKLMSTFKENPNDPDLLKRISNLVLASNEFQVSKKDFHPLFCQLLQRNKGVNVNLIASSDTLLLINNNLSSPGGYTTDPSSKWINESFEVVRSDLVRGMSVSNRLMPFIVRSTFKEGGLTVGEEDRINDIRSNAVTDATSSGLPHCVLAIGTCEAKNVDSRSVMEDRSIVVCGFASLEQSPVSSNPSCFVGVYDGYGGATAAEQSCYHLHRILDKSIQRERTKRASVQTETAVTAADREKLIEDLNLGLRITESDTGEQGGGERENNAVTSNLIDYTAMLRCFHKAYKRMDERLAYGIDETSWARWSGCSAATCIITDEEKSFSQSDGTDGHSVGASGDGSQCKNSRTSRGSSAPSGRIFCANTGDVEAYIFHENKPFALTRKHTGHDDAECERVLKQGGQLFSTGRCLSVNSVSATTRGLGNHGDPDLRKCVISDPFTVTAPINEHSQFVIFATSSIWSSLGVEEVFHLVKSTPEHLSSAPHPMPMPMLYKHCRSDRKQLDTDHDDATADDESELEQRAPKLASIVETDEEMCDEIEEVIIVSARNDDDTSSLVSSSGEVPTLLTGDESASLFAEDLEVKRSTEAHANRGNSTKDDLVQAMCERVVRAAQATGAVENLSIVIILLSGFDQ